MSKQICSGRREEKIIVFGLARVGLGLIIYFVGRFPENEHCPGKKKAVNVFCATRLRRPLSNVVPEHCFLTDFFHFVSFPKLFNIFWSVSILHVGPDQPHPTPNPNSNPNANPNANFAGGSRSAAAIARLRRAFRWRLTIKGFTVGRKTSLDQPHITAVVVVLHESMCKAVLYNTSYLVHTLSVPLLCYIRASLRHYLPLVYKLYRYISRSSRHHVCLLYAHCCSLSRQWLTRQEQRKRRRSQ